MPSLSSNKNSSSNGSTSASIESNLLMTPLSSCHNKIDLSMTSNNSSSSYGIKYNTLMPSLSYNKINASLLSNHGSSTTGCNYDASMPSLSSNNNNFASSLSSNNDSSSLSSNVANNLSPSNINNNHLISTVSSVSVNTVPVYSVSDCKNYLINSHNMIIVNRSNVSTINDNNTTWSLANTSSLQTNVNKEQSFCSPKPNFRPQSPYSTSSNSPVYYRASPPVSPLTYMHNEPLESANIVIPPPPNNSPASPQAPVNQTNFNLLKYRPASLIARTAFNNYKTNIKKKRMTCNELAKRELSLNANGPTYVIHAVSKVLNHKNVDNIRFYFIKWFGWSNDFNSWVRESDCMCPIKILQYKRRFNRANLDEL